MSLTGGGVGVGVGVGVSLGVSGCLVEVVEEEGSTHSPSVGLGTMVVVVEEEGMHLEGRAVSSFSVAKRG